MGEGAAGAAAVLLAACVELSRPSPGSSRGTCELREEDAPIPLVLPVAAPEVATDPLTVVPLLDDSAVDVPDEKDELEGSVDVGTLRDRKSGV